MVTRLMLGFIAAAQLFDVLTTNYALSVNPLAFEGNPLARFMMHQLGSAWWLPKLLVALLCLHAAILMRKSRRHTMLGIAAVSALYAVVIAVNISRF